MTQKKNKSKKSKKTKKENYVLNSLGKLKYVVS